MPHGNTGRLDQWHEHRWICPAAHSATVQVSRTFGLWIVYGSLPRYILYDLLSVYQSSYDLVISKISHIISIGARLTIGTASLTIYSWKDFSKVVQDY